MEWGAKKVCFLMKIQVDLKKSYAVLKRCERMI